MDRIQSYLRETARTNHEVVEITGFSLFFHPTLSGHTFNYAIPSLPHPAGVPESIAEMRREFARRGRAVRIEYIDNYSPSLSEKLKESGLVEVERLPLMACRPQDCRPVPEVKCLSISRLPTRITLQEALAFRNAQNRGFHPQVAWPLPLEEGQRFLERLQHDAAFWGHLDGDLAAVGMYSAPQNQVTEFYGIATLPEFRRKGIAAALTAAMLADAFGREIQVAFLTAADDLAARVYARVGFVHCASSLVYE